jgi:isopenicillin-N N-acyltransferase-like protein
MFIPGWIQDYMETSDEVKRYKAFYSDKEGRKLVDKYLSTGRETYPTYIAEVQGMADGSEVKFEDLFLLQISSELKFCHLKEGQIEKEDIANAGKGCTDVLVNGKRCRMIGHNDDWTADVSSRVYIVHVTIADENERVIEQFVSFSYPGYLTGFCFGMNKSLVISLNSLSPKTANRSGVPVAILLRSLLACSSIEECTSAMECKPCGSAYGMNINIATVHGKEMCSMEVYPQQVMMRSSYS